MFVWSIFSRERKRRGDMRPHPAINSGDGRSSRSAPPLSTRIVRCATRCSPANCGRAISSAPERPGGRFGVSRIVARDALRTLEAQGIVEIKVGSGGGARIAQGNARLFAEALAVQLDLAGVSVAEIMDAQRAIECLAAELAADQCDADDPRGCARSLPKPSASIDDVAGLYALVARIPSRGRRGLAQPRAGGAAHLAQHVVVAGAQPDADAEGRAPHPRRTQGARRADRDARSPPAPAG